MRRCPTCANQDTCPWRLKFHAEFPRPLTFHITAQIRSVASTRYRVDIKATQALSGPKFVFSCVDVHGQIIKADKSREVKWMLVKIR
jgi:hypothetical protein